MPSVVAAPSILSACPRVSPSVLTIDPPLARDLDDAIGASLLRGGGWCVDVCIADVAAAVPSGHALDQAARSKGSTVYAGPMMKEPMLPVTATLAMSLLPRQQRKMVWVRMMLDPNLNVIDLVVTRVEARTRGRLSYGEADAAIADNTHLLHGELVSLSTLAGALFSKRHSASGAIWDTKEGLFTDEEGSVRTLSASEAHRSHLIVQELMILTNAALAAKAVRENRPVLYRNHKPRGLSSGLRADVVKELSSFHGRGKDLLGRIRQLNSRIGPAELGIAAGGHWALNLPAYAWFTSPLRRYADLVNLRALFGEPVPRDLGAVADELTLLERTRREAAVERQRAKALASLVPYVERGDALSLQGIPFRRVVRACEAAGVHGLDLRAEFLHRLAMRTLESKDAYFLLTEGQWAMAEDMSARLVDHIMATRGLPLQIANHLLQKGIIDPPAQCPTHRETDNLLWRNAAEVMNLKDLDLPEAVPSTTVASNPKGAALELAQARGASLTFLPATKSGGDHEPVFRCGVVWDKGGDRLTCHGEGGTKKEAERSAALALMSKLVPEALSDVVTVGVRPEDNPKGRLLERATRERATVRFSEALRSGPDHAPMFAVTVRWSCRGNIWEADGKASSKKAAEQQAASILIDRIDIA
jgi:ribonuclease R